MDSLLAVSGFSWERTYLIMEISKIAVMMPVICFSFRFFQKGGIQGLAKSAIQAIAKLIFAVMAYAKLGPSGPKK
jgi:hypothetical protein